MSTTRTHRAFTLIEVIIIVAVVSVLALAIMVPAVRQLDRAAGKKEAMMLKKMADAYKERITVTRIIPGHTGWAAAVGAHLGLELNDVTNNVRGLRRVFLIDPILAIGNNFSFSLPYVQTAFGHTMANLGGQVIRPVSPRAMMISSISSPLPSSLVSGVGATVGANAFTNIWDTPEGGIPAGWAFADGDDLKIQRIDLSDLFIQVILNDHDPARVPSYATDVGTNNISASATSSIETYYIKGTELRLLDHNLGVDYSEILFSPASFMFDLGKWQGGTYLGRNIGHPGPLDLQRAMNLFLSVDPNVTANHGATQMAVHDQMVRYMSNFIMWRSNGYPTINASSEMRRSQADLATETVNLIDPR